MRDGAKGRCGRCLTFGSKGLRGGKGQERRRGSEAREEEEEARGDEAGGWWTKESEAGRRRGTSLVCKGRAEAPAQKRKRVVSGSSAVR